MRQRKNWNHFLRSLKDPLFLFLFFFFLDETKNTKNGNFLMAQNGTTTHLTLKYTGDEAVKSRKYRLFCKQKQNTSSLHRALAGWPTVSSVHIKILGWPTVTQVHKYNCRFFLKKNGPFAASFFFIFVFSTNWTNCRLAHYVPHYT